MSADSSAGQGTEARAAERVLKGLRERGYRMTPQRLAIVDEIMSTEGHITPQVVAQRVKERIPGVNVSTIYRTLELLESLGIVSHAHLEKGPEYHRKGEHEHVHLVCSRCGQEDYLASDQTAPLQELIVRHKGFKADFTHFAVAGICADCQRRAGT